MRISKLAPLALALVCGCGNGIIGGDGAGGSATNVKTGKGGGGGSSVGGSGGGRGGSGGTGGSGGSASGGSGGSASTGGSSGSGGTGGTGGRTTTGTGGATGTGGSTTTGTGGGTGGSGSGGIVGTGGSTGTGGTGGSVVGPTGCAIFPANDVWNQDISALPASASWTAKVQGLAGSVNLHPDFGPDFGIPYNVVPQSQPLVPMTWGAYGSQSDPGPYPFPGPTTIKMEGDPLNCSGDCHALVVQQGVCMLYEGFNCMYSNGWICDAGAKWDLNKLSRGQRPDGWTSADAAGLSVFAGLVRYDEVTAGAMNHAARFTVNCPGGHVAPATHDSSTCSNPNALPMGLRVRLKASFDISSYNPTAQVILKAFKKYGLINADFGSNFFITGEQNPNWNNDILSDLKRVSVSNFEAVDPPAN